MHYSEWSEERKEASRRANRRWNAKNKGIRAEYWKEYYKRRSHSYTLLKPARDRSNKIGLDFNLQETDIIIPANCPICNTPMKRSKTKGGSKNSPTLDRIKPEFGYTKGNVAVICKMCNSTKGNGSASLHRKIADFIDSFI